MIVRCNAKPAGEVVDGLKVQRVEVIPRLNIKPRPAICELKQSVVNVVRN